MPAIDNDPWSAEIMTHQTPIKAGARPDQRHPWRLMMAVTALALGAGLSQMAWAQPKGEPGALGAHAHAHHRSHHGGPEMGGSPRQMDRMLDAVKATPEQRAQIKQITDAARADMAAQREEGRKLHEQNRALFAQPTVDARSAETLRQQMMAQHDQASKRMLLMKLDISRVLSPEQRAAIAERMKMRGDMMQRHRQGRYGDGSGHAPGQSPGRNEHSQPRT